MADYEQMEFDVRLESDRCLQENVNLAIDFACKQVQQERQKPIENRHEAYGILAEQYARVQKSMKDVNDSFKKYALILPLDDAAAVEASNSIVNAATEAVYEAVELVALANKAMQDLYRNSSRESTPLEDYMEEQENDGFEEAEDALESEDEDAE